MIPPRGPLAFRTAAIVESIVDPEGSLPPAQLRRLTAVMVAILLLPVPHRADDPQPVSGEIVAAGDLPRR